MRFSVQHGAFKINVRCIGVFRDVLNELDSNGPYRVSAVRNKAHISTPPHDPSGLGSECNLYDAEMFRPSLDFFSSYVRSVVSTHTDMPCPTLSRAHGGLRDRRILCPRDLRRLRRL
eukprot:5711202-Pyramimonas_sp.AAC.1